MSHFNLIDTIVEVAEGLEGRPSWDEYFMATAFLIATRSACQRLNVGCVIVSKGLHKNRIIAAGYNGFLPGAPHISRMIVMSNPRPCRTKCNIRRSKKRVPYRGQRLCNSLSLYRMC